MAPDRHFELEGDLRRYETLLRAADLVARQGGLADLFADLVGLLRDVAVFDFAAFSLYNSANNLMHTYLWDGSQLNPAPFELPLDNSPMGWVWQNQQPLVVSDYLSDKRFQPLSEALAEKGMRSYCVLPLTSARRRLGGLGLGSTSVGAYGEHDVRLLHRVAALATVGAHGGTVMTRAHLLRSSSYCRTMDAGLD